MNGRALVPVRSQFHRLVRNIRCDAHAQLRGPFVHNIRCDAHVQLRGPSRRNHNRNPVPIPVPIAIPIGLSAAIGLSAVYSYESVGFCSIISRI